MEEFSEEELQQLIDTALSENDSPNPFVPQGPRLGLGESQMMSSLHERLSKRFIESEINDIFRDVRKDINTSTFNLTLRDIHTVTKNCRKCQVDSTAELPKWNLDNPDIVVIIDAPNLPQEGVSVMLNAFKEAGLKSDQLCLTYVNRCPVQRKYEYQEVQNCANYLHNEIVCLNPKLILGLGLLPGTILFGDNIKLKDYRGSVTWLGNWPILLTYSPLYVLRSGENAQDTFNNDIKQAFNYIQT